MFLHVSQHYSARQIPGFLTVPYNFRPEELARFFRLHAEELFSERQKYEHYHDAMKEQVARLKAENNIELGFEEFSGNEDIYRKLLMAKRLGHYKLGEKLLVVPFDETDYKYFCREYGLSEEQSCHLLGRKAVLRIDFSDHEFREMVEKHNL